MEPLVVHSPVQHNQVYPEVNWIIICIELSSPQTMPITILGLEPDSRARREFASLAPSL